MLDEAAVVDPLVFKIVSGGSTGAVSGFVIGAFFSGVACETAIVGILLASFSSGQTCLAVTGSGTLEAETCVEFGLDFDSTVGEVEPPLDDRPHPDFRFSLAHEPHEDRYAPAR